MPKKIHVSLEDRKRFNRNLQNEPKISVITYEGLTTELCKN
jgi:pantetheine-phosphate adenylyltransferase